MYIRNYNKTLLKLLRSLNEVFYAFKPYTAVRLLNLSLLVGTILDTTLCIYVA